MMWPARAAIRPVPSHAVVPQYAIDGVESDFTNTDDLETRVDRAFLTLDTRQPAIARFIARTVDGLRDDTAQALGHFLGVAVHEAFSSAFGSRLGQVEDSGLEMARASLEVDEELRRGAPDDALETDDLVAMAQPHLVAFVRQQMDAALEPDEDGDASDVDVEAVEGIYRAVLVEILALSHAVRPPQGAAPTVYLA